MDKTDLENIELEFLLKTINKQYGYDFSNYSPASLKRRIVQFIKNTGYNRISEIILRLLDERAFFESFFLTISITVTEMFRDPFKETRIPGISQYT